MMRVRECLQTPLSVRQKPPSTLNQISPHLNIPFIHMSYCRDPYGSALTVLRQREPVNYRWCVYCTWSMSNQTQPDAAYSFTFGKTHTHKKKLIQSKSIMIVALRPPHHMCGHKPLVMTKEKKNDSGDTISRNAVSLQGGWFSASQSGFSLGGWRSL